MMHARLFKIVEANACVEVAVVKEDGADSAAGANDEVFVERECKLRVACVRMLASANVRCCTA